MEHAEPPDPEVFRGLPPSPPSLHSSVRQFCLKIKTILVWWNELHHFQSRPAWILCALHGDIGRFTIERDHVRHSVFYPSFKLTEIQGKSSSSRWESPGRRRVAGRSGRLTRRALIDVPSPFPVYLRAAPRGASVCFRATHRTTSRARPLPRSGSRRLGDGARRRTAG